MTCYATQTGNGITITRTPDTIVFSSVARRLEDGTYLPHRAPPVGAPLRAHATPSATPIENTLAGALLGALAGTAIVILAALVTP